MSVRIDENTDHMKYTDDMEAIDSDIMDRVIAEMNSYDADIYTAKDVKEALAAETCSVDNFKVVNTVLPFLITTASFPFSAFNITSLFSTLPKLKSAVNL